MVKKVENTLGYIDNFNKCLTIIILALIIIWILKILFSYSTSKFKSDSNYVEVAADEYFTEDGQEIENTNESIAKKVVNNNTKNNAMWWPIGSNDVNVIDEKKYASSTPVCTNYIIDINSTYSTSPIYALDISCGGANIIAVMDGTVESTVDSCSAWNMVGGESTGAQAACGGTYGNNVVIDHGNGIKTRYAHLASVNVKAGDEVYQGEIIGIEGNTGHVIGSTGIHLHFEVLVNNQRVIPTNGYVSALDTRPTSGNVFLNNS